jgi:hypothetical protein
MTLLASTSRRSGLPRTLPKPLEESDESLDEQASDGTCHTNAGGMRGDADYSLVRAVGSGAVRERNDGKPEQPTERNADRQPCQARRSKLSCHSQTRITRDAASSGTFRC